MKAENDKPRPEAPIELPPLINPHNRILVVEDNAIILNAIGQILTHQGHEVDQAHGGAEANRKICNTKYDIVLTDFDICGLDCICFATWLKQSSPDTKLVIMTVRCEAEFASHLNNPVVDHWMIKPFGRRELESMLKRLYSESTDVINQESQFIECQLKPDHHNQS